MAIPNPKLLDAMKRTTPGMGAKDQVLQQRGSIPQMTPLAQAAQQAGPNPTIDALRNTQQQYSAAGRTYSMPDFLRDNPSAANPNTYNAQNAVFKPPSMPQQIPPTVMSATANTQGVSGGSIPKPVDAVTNVRSSTALQQQAGDSNAIERAALKNAIDTTMQGLRNNANYTNKLIGDERRLKDSTRTQVANPFANLGRTSFTEGLVQRGRDIDDSARGANLDNQLNSYTQELMNFDRLAPERQRQIYAELLEKERTFGLNQANVTGEYAGNQTMAARNADRNFNLQEGQLLGNYNGQQTLQGQNQQFNQGMQNKQFDYGVERDQIGDEQARQKFSYQVASDEWDRNFKGQQFDFNKAQQLYENSFKNKSFEQSVKQAAQQLGLNYAKMSQDETQFASEMAYKKEVLAQNKFEEDVDNAFRRREFDLAEQKANQPQQTTIEAKESTDNYIEAKTNIEDLSRSEALKYAQGIKGYLTDSDYKALVKYIDENNFN